MPKVDMAMRVESPLAQQAPSILIVDDEPEVVWMLQFSLEAEGYRTFSARDGRLAIAEIRERRPDVVLLDIMMPITDGWSVLEEMRDLPGGRPRVVVLSARSSMRDRAKAAELGADHFMPKPFNMDDLLSLLAQLSP